VSHISFKFWGSRSSSCGFLVLVPKQLEEKHQPMSDGLGFDVSLIGVSHVVHTIMQMLVEGVWLGWDARMAVAGVRGRKMKSVATEMGGKFIVHVPRVVGEMGGGFTGCAFECVPCHCGGHIVWWQTVVVQIRHCALGGQIWTTLVVVMGGMV